jgi:hypothetical protein
MKRKAIDYLRHGTNGELLGALRDDTIEMLEGFERVLRNRKNRQDTRIDLTVMKSIFTDRFLTFGRSGFSQLRPEAKPYGPIASALYLLDEIVGIDGSKLNELWELLDELRAARDAQRQAAAKETELVKA